MLPALDPALDPDLKFELLDPTFPMFGLLPAPVSGKSLLIEPFLGIGIVLTGELVSFTEVKNVAAP